METNKAVSVSNNPFDVFVTGARKGFHIAIHNLMPNVVMAYVLAEVLNLLGIMPFLGQVFAPIMGLLGLPGEAITVLLTNGLFTGADITVVVPAIFLIGSQLQYMGRLLGVADVPKKYWPLLMLTSISNALIAMFVMRLFIQE